MASMDNVGQDCRGFFSKMALEGRPCGNVGRPRRDKPMTTYLNYIISYYLCLIHIVIVGTIIKGCFLCNYYAICLLLCTKQSLNAQNLLN